MNAMRPDEPGQPAGKPVSAGVQAGTAVLEAETLFRGTREIVIAHGGERYRLRITQNGKLILTK